MIQNLLLQPDADAERMAFMVTALPDNVVEEAKREQEEAPQLRPLQRAMAAAVVRDLHGEKELAMAERATNILYGAGGGGGGGGDKKGWTELSSLAPEEVAEVLAGVPSTECGREDSIAAAIVSAGLAPSLGAARRLVDGGGIRVNGTRVEKGGGGAALGKEAFVGGYCILRAGKKKQAVLHLIK